MPSVDLRRPAFRGQTIAGVVTRVEPGQWVEMRNQTSGKIIVRIDRIDGIAAP